MKKIIFFIVLILFLAIFYFIEKNQSKENIINTIKPKIQDLVIKVDVIGKVYCNSLVSVSTLANGEIQEFRVKTGDKLKKGDVIAILDDKKEKIILESEKSKLISLNDEKIASEIYLEELLHKFNSQEKLYKKGASSKEAYLNSKTNYYNAKAKLSNIKSQIQQTKANIANYEESLEETIVKAPISGTIIGTYASVGDTINSRQSSATLVKMADLSKLEVRMQIPQNDINLLKVGQNINYIALSDGSQYKKSKLASIDYADLEVVSGKASDGAVYYNARYNVENDDSLKIGMNVQSIIEIETIKNALTLPINYIKKDNQGFYVKVKNAEKIEKKYLTLGKSDDFNIEIKSGLSENDEVVTDNDQIK